eukprot:TRINITY_DN4451_c0_g1_i3.p1 TRINITY_DN4451_c0_g1~~TRINITY_DN4451_c0_g1_i3.p1  ORF type:complete len:124 (-),score=24.18 TRINITY_DN4451_c0_g1_i3:162-533(-)
MILLVSSDMVFWIYNYFIVYIPTPCSDLFIFFFFLMIRRPPRSTQSRSSAASDVYKRQYQRRVRGALRVDDEHIVSSVNSRNTSYRSLPERPTGQINRTAADLRKLPEQKKATFRCQYGAIRG